MSRVRVLVVDDEVRVRRGLSQAFASVDEFDVIGTAAHGRIAVARTEQLAPEIVVLDLDMPEMDGWTALSEMKARRPSTLVIAIGIDSASEETRAIREGATAYISKGVDASGGYTTYSDAWARDVVACATGLVSKERWAEARRGAFRMATSSGGGRSGVDRRVDVVAVGVSTGGPDALEQVFRTLPASLPVPIVMVQHMPEEFTQALANRLTACSSLEVREGRDGMPLNAGEAIIAPGGEHMAVLRKGTSVQVVTHREPPEHSCRPAVDVLFRSVAQVFGPHVLGVVLTGMGKDGLIGAEHIVASGGRVIVQDEASSVVWGMPGFVARAGIADGAFGIDQIGAEIVRRVTKWRDAA